MRTGVAQRLDDLARRFDEALAVASPFTGPSRYFHGRSISRRRECGSASAAALDGQFAELVYATLATWGMHRMGGGGPKMMEFEAFAARLAASARELEGLQRYTLADDVVRSQDFAARLWGVVIGVSPSSTDSHLVAGSKVVHHLLPELLPPIDREYTLRFFGEQARVQYNPVASFREALSGLSDFAAKHPDLLRRHDEAGWNTSTTKVLDNALVGYMKLAMPRRRATSEN